MLDLIIVLQTDNDYHVRIASSYALGQIGNRFAVPALVDPLFEENSEPYSLSISCAEAISFLTEVKFRDAGSMAYSLGGNGIPLIVMDARTWW